MIFQPGIGKYHRLCSSSFATNVLILTGVLKSLYVGRYIITRELGSYFVYCTTNHHELHVVCYLIDANRPWKLSSDTFLNLTFSNL